MTEKIIIGLPAPTVTKTALIPTEIFDEIMNIPLEEGEPIFIDLVKIESSPP